MEYYVKTNMEFNGTSETYPLAGMSRISGPSKKQSSAVKKEELSEQKNDKKNGYCHTRLTNGNKSSVNSTDKSGRRDAREEHITNRTFTSEEINSRMPEEPDTNTNLNCKSKNGMAHSTCYLLQVNRGGNQNKSREKLQNNHSENRFVKDIGVKCDVHQLKSIESGVVPRNDGDANNRRDDNNRLSGRVAELTVETQSEDELSEDVVPMKVTVAEENTTVTGKLEKALHEKEVIIHDLTKQLEDLKQEIRKFEIAIEQCEKEKVEIQEKYDEAFLKVVGDNRKMNESLKAIQEHVRREKIESERTKKEVELVLHERQKLVDQIKELTNGFESMVGERNRMEKAIDTSISAFDSTLCAKDEEIRNLQETIDNDRRQFVEERDEYLIVIDSLKTQLLLQEAHTRN